MIKIRYAPHAGKIEELQIPPSNKELPTEDDLMDYIAFELFCMRIRYKWFKVIT